MEGGSLAMSAGANPTILGQFDRPSSLNAFAFQPLDFYGFAASVGMVQLGPI
jgi:hypothetical protein